MPSKSDVGAIVARHDPAAYRKPIERRPDSGLPFDPDSMPPDLPVMLDTGFYIDRLKGRLGTSILEFVAGRPVLHSGVACSELAIALGILDPGHPTTAIYTPPILHVLGAIDLAQTVAPSAAAWAEAGMVAGILARTQHLNASRKSLGPEDAELQDGRRRKLLNDALLFLNAVEVGAILVTANARDIDLMRRMRPGAHVLFYKPVARTAGHGR